MSVCRRLEKAIAMVGPYAALVLAIIVSVDAVAHHFDQPGLLGAADSAVKAIHDGVTDQLDALDAAISDARARFEHACVQGIPY